MTNAFTFNGIEYSKNEKGYCYKFNSDKKVRIGKAEYEQAYQDAKAESEYWAKKEKAEQDAKATEDAFNGTESAIEAKVEEMELAGDGTPLAQVGKEIAQQAKAKAKKARKSKDIAFTYTENDVVVTLTKKQVDFIKEMPNDDFYEHGLDSALWIDVFCDTVADKFNAMAVGAMVSTLREKGLVIVAQEKMNGKKCKFFEFTEKGKAVAKALGLK